MSKSTAAELSATDKFYNYLNSGKACTTEQARKRFGVKNVAHIVYVLRNSGVPVYTNRRTLRNGEEQFEYRIGTPSDKFLRNMKNRKRDRARRALYENALSS